MVKTSQLVAWWPPKEGVKINSLEDVFNEWQQGISDTVSPFMASLSRRADTRLFLFALLSKLWKRTGFTVAAPQRGASFCPPALAWGDEKTSKISPTLLPGGSWTFSFLLKVQRGRVVLREGCFETQEGLTGSSGFQLSVSIQSQPCTPHSLHQILCPMEAPLLLPEPTAPASKSF